MTLTFTSIVANLPPPTWLWTCPHWHLVEGQADERRVLQALYTGPTNAFLPLSLHPVPTLPIRSSSHVTSFTMTTWSCVVPIHFPPATAMFPLRRSSTWGQGHQAQLWHLKQALSKSFLVDTFENPSVFCG